MKIRNSLVIVLSCVALVGLSDNARLSQLRSLRPRIVAHRGAGDLTMPEASLPAYSNAVETVCDIVKLDLQCTKDGVAVMGHDPTLSRNMGWDVAIADLTYAEIYKKGRFIVNGRPSDLRIVRLDEALRVACAVPEIWLDFKYFSPTFAGKVLKECRSARIDESRLMIATFSRPALAYFQKNHPGIRRVGHIDVRRFPDGSWRFPSASEMSLVAGVREYASKYGLFGVNMPVERHQTSQTEIEELQRCGLWVSVWFVQNKTLAKEYQMADAFVTDHVSGVRMDASCNKGADAGDFDISKYDRRMAVEDAVVATNGIKWIDGKRLPLEGKCFTDTDDFYDRLPKNVTTNVNAGVRSMKHHAAGLQFRFRTDSKTLDFKWIPYNKNLTSGTGRMSFTGASGIDIYRQEPDGLWRYVNTGCITSAEQGGALHVEWKPGTPCLVNLPLYNGIKSFSLGVEDGATVEALGPRKSGINKPVVFYGTSITQGGCASRPGLSFPSIIGRDLDVPIVNLGFSGSGRMELEMSEHLAAIDASCYVLDCLWNMGESDVRERYEPFIRNLRRKRPCVPIIMAEQCDVYCNGPSGKDRFVKTLYGKLIAEGWASLVYLPKTDMFAGDAEGTVDGCHPNDWGMMAMAKAFGAAVKDALGTKR